MSISTTSVSAFTWFGHDNQTGNVTVSTKMNRHILYHRKQIIILTENMRIDKCTQNTFTHTRHNRSHQINSEIYRASIALRFQFQFIDRMIFDYWMRCLFSGLTEPRLHDKYFPTRFFSMLLFICDSISLSLPHFFYRCQFTEQCHAFLWLLFVNFALFDGTL